MADSRALDLLETLILDARRHGADKADAMMAESTDMNCVCRLGKPEELERAESAGLGLRVMLGQKQAAVSTTDFSAESLSTLVERAVTMAKATPDDRYLVMAEEAQLCSNPEALDLLDEGEPDAEALMRKAEEVEKAARDVQGVTNSEGGEAGYRRSSITLVTSEGFQGAYDKSYHSVSVSVLAGEGTKMQRDYDYTMARKQADLRDAQDVGREAAERTVRKLNPRKLSTRQVPVIFDRRTARGLLGNLASAVNGSAIARGTSFLKEKMDQRIFAQGVQVTDDPLRQKGLGSRPFDAEGLAGRPTHIIKDGVLCSWLLDLGTALQLELESTGNASRGLSSSPSPSSSNFTLEAGTQSPEEMISSMNEGFYITEAFGMGVNLVTGDYSQGAGGFWIENGQIAYPVQEVTIAGHLLEMFAQLTPANDLIFESSTSSPSVYIDRMTIAGA